ANVDALYQSAFLLALQGKFSESRALIDRLPPEARDRPQALAVLTADLAGLGAQTVREDRAHAEAIATAARLAAHPDLTAADILSVLPVFGLPVFALPAFARGSGDAIPQQLLEALDTRGLASTAVLWQLAELHLRHARYAEARAILERA